MTADIRPELEGLVSSQNLESLPRLIDADQAAELLSVPASWIRAQARADRIPWVPMGRYVRFEPEQLVAWWRARARGPVRSAAELRLVRRTGCGPVSPAEDAA